MHCFIVVRLVVVECRALKPCCVDERGMCGVILLRISLSRILTGLHNNEIGVYNVGFVRVLFGLSMGMMPVRTPWLPAQGVSSVGRICHRGLWIL